MLAPLEGFIELQQMHLTTLGIPKHYQVLFLLEQSDREQSP
jgi:hypothetical protein